jgi:cell division control protein 7
MLLSLLSHKFPLFNSADDIEAFMEIAAVFGRNAMEKCAMLHSESSINQASICEANEKDRTLMTNVPTVEQNPPNLSELVLTLNPHLYTPPLAAPTPEEAQIHIDMMDHALDLCSKLLKLDATKRISAKHALNHPFFTMTVNVNENEEPAKPILTGLDGKCGHLHTLEDGKRESFHSRFRAGY